MALHVFFWRKKLKQFEYFDLILKSVEQAFFSLATVNELIDAHNVVLISYMILLTY